MSSSFSNDHLTDMHFIYGFCNGNAAVREYHVRFPTRVVPTVRTFQRLHQRLKESGSFKRKKREHNRRNDVNEDIMLSVIDDPETSTRAVSRKQWKVWNTIRQEGFHLYHFTRVQGLEPNDHQQRVVFVGGFCTLKSNHHIYSVESCGRTNRLSPGKAYLMFTTVITMLPKTPV